MKYCCKEFEEGVKRHKESYPNIRIVKFVSESFTNPSGVFRLAKDVDFYHDNVKKSRTGFMSLPATPLLA
jgi:hypothetical protein